MKDLFLLIRRISAYTGPDVLLGVFTDARRAGAARDEYRRRHLADPSRDPWREQAYKTGGLAADDLVVEALDAPVGMTDEVFVVSRYFEGFGQVVRKFDSVHASLAAARTREAELDALEEDEVAYVLLQPARVDTSLSDAPDDQPSISGP